MFYDCFQIITHAVSIHSTFISHRKDFYPKREEVVSMCKIVQACINYKIITEKPFWMENNFENNVNIAPGISYAAHYGSMKLYRCSNIACSRNYMFQHIRLKINYEIK